jgi:hypothetical protein
VNGFHQNFQMTAGSISPTASANRGSIESDSADSAPPLLLGRFGADGESGHSLVVRLGFGWLAAFSIFLQNFESCTFVATG